MRNLSVIFSLAMLLALAGCVTKEASVESGNTDDAVKIIDLGGGVKMEFVLIRPGTFTMGCEKGQASDEKPAHEVTITKPFYIGKFEVTQEQWKAVMGENPSHFAGDKNPVERVSWPDCQTFLRKLAEKVPGQTFRLPTEAEWEYACRAGSVSEYCYGDDDRVLGDYAWYGGNSAGETHPVGQKKPNAWGLYDMHGNVWEWCSDWYGSYKAEEQKDPAGPADAQGRVLRGGSWNYGPVYCRSAGRGGVVPAGLCPRCIGLGDHFGIRVVCGAGVD